MPGKRLPESQRRGAILEGAFRVATRDQLGGLSIRAVAEAAGVSKGLVFFHFKDKETLLLALLDWLLEQGPKLELPPDLDELKSAHPARRLLRVLHHQVAGLPARRQRVELFLDFWVMGTGEPAMRERIRQAFQRYRGEFLPYTRPVVAALPERFDADADVGLAGTVVSFIQGCALQMLSDPVEFDVDRYMRAVEGLVLARPEEGAP